jgi:ABC-type polysaccharide/polyol phosphate export permease
MTPIVEVFRLAFLGTSAIDPIWLMSTGAFTGVVILAEGLIFNHVESTFMDTV